MKRQANREVLIDKVSVYGRNSANRAELLLQMARPELVSPLIEMATGDSVVSDVVGRLEQDEDRWVDPFEDRELIATTMVHLPADEGEGSRQTLAFAWALCSLAGGFSYGNVITSEDFE